MSNDNHQYFAFGSCICSFTYITIYSYLFWKIYLFLFSHLCQSPLKLDTHAYVLYNVNTYEVLIESYIFYIWQPYLFFLNCGHLTNHCLADILAFLSFMPITSEIVHTFIYKSDTTAYTDD